MNQEDISFLSVSIVQDTRRHFKFNLIGCLWNKFLCIGVDLWVETGKVQPLENTLHKHCGSHTTPLQFL